MLNQLLINFFDLDYNIIRNKKTNKICECVCNYIYCEFKCLSEDKMKRHFNQIHINKDLIKCEECDQFFWTQNQLKVHVKECHNEVFDERTQKFKCNYNGCELKFKHFCKLLTHKNRHFGEKSFKCSDEYPGCKWSFFTSQELKKHQIWSHDKQKPLVCDWNGCGQEFVLRKLLGNFEFSFLVEKI